MQPLDDYVHVEDDDGSDNPDPTDPSVSVRNHNLLHARTDRTRVSFLIGNRVSLDLDPPRTTMRATRSIGAGPTTLTVGQTSMGTDSNLPPLGVRPEPTQSTHGVGVSHANIGGTIQMTPASMLQPTPTGFSAMAPASETARTERGLANIASYLEQPISQVQPGTIGYSPNLDVESALKLTEIETMIQQILGVQEIESHYRILCYFTKVKDTNRILRDAASKR